MDWFRLHNGLPAHPKIGRLARRLGIDRDRSLAIVVRLLCWTAQSKETGDLNGTHPEDLADAVAWDGDAEKLVEALVAAGWLDSRIDGYVVHEWRQYQDSVFQNREKARNWRQRTGTLPYRTVSELATDRQTDIETTPPPPPRKRGGASRLRSMALQDLLAETEAIRKRAYPNAVMGADAKRLDALYGEIRARERSGEAQP